MAPREISERLKVIVDALKLRGNITISFTYANAGFAPLMQGLRVYCNGEQVIGWEKFCADRGEEISPPTSSGLHSVEPYVKDKP